LFSSMGTAQSAYLFRHLMVKQKAQAQIIGLAVSGTLAVILALKGLSYWSIAIQGVVYVAVVTFMLWLFSPWRPGWPVSFEPLKKMYGFSGKVLITNLFNHINNNILTVLLGKLFSPSQVGDYTQASKWNAMSSNVIINMINGVAQPVLAEAAEEKERHKRVFRKMLKFTAFLSFPAMFGLAIIAEEFIVLTITAKWLPSVPLLQVLCVGGGFAPITYLYTHLIISKGKSSIYMWNVIALGILQVFLMLSLSSYGILMMVIGFVTLNILWLMVWHSFVRREIDYSLRETLTDIVFFALISFLIMLFVYHLMSGVESMLLRLILKVVIGAILYALIMLLFQRSLIIETIRMIFKIKNK
ncbi:MAG: oligosaccharide flippase family protein, partial [Bacteroidales bacterium]|nr:oligosaccharide flippase family protein [Bacteroidales bacterium]